MKVGNLPEKKFKVMATDPSVLAWRIPWTEKPGGLYSLCGRKESDPTEWLSLTHSLSDGKDIQRTWKKNAQSEKLEVFKEEKTRNRDKDDSKWNERYTKRH